MPLEKAAGAYVKAKDFGQAMVVLEKQAKLFAQIEEANNVTKNILSQIIVHLANGDFVAADQAFTDGMQGPFVTSDEQPLADAMLDAYDGGDQDGLDQVTRDQTFSFLPNDIAVLARKLKAEGSGGGRATKTLADLNIDPTPAQAPAPAPTPAPAPAPEVEALPEPTPEPVAAPEASPEPAPAPVDEPEPAPVVVTAPEPAPDPVVVAEPEPEPAAPAPEPAAPAPEPAAAPAPAAEQEDDGNDSDDLL